MGEEEILIKHQKLEQSIEELINSSGLPLVMVSDVFSRVAEKLNHQLSVQTFVAIQNQNRKEENKDAVHENTVGE
jgi:hypothetical protein